MKRKVIPLVCAAAIIGSPIVTFASGSDVNLNHENGLNQQVEETEENQSVMDSENKIIKELTLDDVITLGIDNSRELKVANLNIEIIKNEVEMATKDREKVVLKLENALDDYEVKQESVKQALTSSYFTLFILKKNIKVKKNAVQTIRNEVDKVQELYALGRITTKKLNEALLAQEKAEQQFKDMKRNYDDLLSALCLNIGVTYHPEIELKPVKLEMKKVSKPLDLDSLIDNSNQVKMAKRQLETLILERDRGDYTSVYEKENQDYRVKIAEQNLITTKEEVKKIIEQLYRDAEQTYSSFQEAVRLLGDKEYELQRLDIFYNLGRISDYEFDKEGIGLAEANLNVLRSKTLHYQSMQSIDAVQKGLF